jgi:hypothetical protein
MNNLTATTHHDALRARRAQLLDFRLDAIADKLVHTGVAADREQAELLFREVKRYLLLSDRNPLPMVSALVDAAWHQFILYTVQYEQFCMAWCSKLLHHAPGAPDAGVATPEEMQQIEGFFDAYWREYGALPDVWFNDRCLRDCTFLSHAEWPHGMEVVLEADRALLVRSGEDARVLCRASARAYEALRFVAGHRRFLLREVAGLRGFDERLQLITPLVKWSVLIRLA